MRCGAQPSRCHVLSQQRYSKETLILLVLYVSHRSQLKKASICHQQTSVVIFFFVIQCFSTTFQRIGICSHVLWRIQEGCAQFTHSSSFQPTCSWSLRPTGWFQTWPSLHADTPSTLHLWWEKIKIACLMWPGWTVIFYRDSRKYPGELLHASSRILLTQQECVNRHAKGKSLPGPTLKTSHKKCNFTASVLGWHFKLSLNAATDRHQCCRQSVLPQPWRDAAAGVDQMLANVWAPAESGCSFLTNLLWVQWQKVEIPNSRNCECAIIETISLDPSIKLGYSAVMLPLEPWHDVLITPTCRFSIWQFSACPVELTSLC